MSTPANRPDASESPLDERLREAFDFMSAPPGTVPPPPPHLWAGVEAGMRPPVSTTIPRRAPWLAGFAGLMIGMLLMWALLPTKPTFWSTKKDTARTTLAQALPKKGGDLASDLKTAPNLGGARPSLGETSGSDVKPPPYLGGARPQKGGGRSYLGAASGSNPKTPSYLGGASGSDKGFSGSDPLPTGFDSLRLGSDPKTPVIPTVLLPLVGTEQTLGVLATDSTLTARVRRRDALLMQRAALVRLQLRTDSLLLALAPVAETTAVATVDSTPVAPLKNRWSVALSFAPERNFFGLNAPAADTLAALRRTHEQGRGGYNAAVMAEYRLTPRWSVGAGAGLSTTGAELRFTDRRTQFTTQLVTTDSMSVSTSTVITYAYSIRTVYDPTLSPRYNSNFQIIGFDTVLVPRPDTVWTRNTVTGYDTTHTRITTPIISKAETVTARTLRPNYRFLTLPLMVRYRLGRAQDWASSPTAPRWWADVAVGAQLQWFLGGTQLVTDDGHSYRTQRVSAAAGPFRPLNVAVTGAIAVNYALTERWSASLAPAVRWQARSIYKPSTQLGQRPLATGLQLGVRYSF